MSTQTSEQLLVQAQEWREAAALADCEGKESLATTCRAEAVSCEKQADGRR